MTEDEHKLVDAFRELTGAANALLVKARKLGIDVSIQQYGGNLLGKADTVEIEMKRTTVDFECHIEGVDTPATIR